MAPNSIRNSHNKELVVIGGKSGTGTTITPASFAALAKSAVFADCGVDAKKGDRR
jgi:MinD superfamily P-loop ATPase